MSSRILHACSKNKRPIKFEYRIIASDGSIRTVAGTQRFLFDAEGEVARIAGALQDITERKEAEEALKASEDTYRTLFEKSADSILIIEGDKFVDCNQATVDMLGYRNKQELLETHPSQLSPEFQPDGRSSYEKANEMMAIAFKRGSHRFEWDHIRQNGEVFPVEVLLTAAPMRDRMFLHVVWRDITERKRLEELESRAARLDTAGTIAGQVAHDFNNLLAPLVAFPEIIKEELTPDHPAYSTLETMEQAAKKIADINQQLLTLGR
ncbi:MAG: PAS domain S-box protein, partial [Candidatus Zixiibacteriota bacterium]